MIRTAPSRTAEQTATFLYIRALQADARFSETCNGRGVTRWTPNALLFPEVADAYRVKVNADEAWLTFLRTTR